MKREEALEYVGLTEKGAADVFGNLVPRFRLRKVAQLLVQHPFELKKKTVKNDKIIRSLSYGGCCRLDLSTSQPTMENYVSVG